MLKSSIPKLQGDCFIAHASLLPYECVVHGSCLIPRGLRLCHGIASSPGVHFFVETYRSQLLIPAWVIDHDNVARVNGQMYVTTSHTHVRPTRRARPLASTTPPRVSDTPTTEQTAIISVMQGTVWGEPEQTWEDANGDNENRIK